MPYELDYYGTKMVRVVVMCLPNRSVATKVSIDPPRGKVSVVENDPSSLRSTGSPFSVSFAIRSTVPFVVTMPLGKGAPSLGDAILRAGPAMSGHASMKPYAARRKREAAMRWRVIVV